MYSLSLAELIDRMNIIELKIINSKTDEAKLLFQRELVAVMEDIHESGISALLLRAVAALSMANISIWENENSVREADGKELTDEEKIKLADQLIKTHKLNADRSAAKAQIQRLTSGRLDEKLNYISGLWNIKY